MINNKIRRSVYNIFNQYKDGNKKSILQLNKNKINQFIQGNNSSLFNIKNSSISDKNGIGNFIEYSKKK